MSNFDSVQHPRGHASNPGSFSEKSQSEPESALTAAVRPAAVSIAAVADLETSYLDDLPGYPADLPAPNVSWELSDGRVETFVQVGDRGITFWQNDEDESFNSFENRLGFSDADASDQALLDWGTALNGRINNLHYETQHAIVSQTQAAVLNAALGRPMPPEDELEPNAVTRGIARADRVLSVWGLDLPTGNESAIDRAEIEQTAVSDALTDLRHWAAAHDIDIDAAAIASSATMFDDEQESPED